MQNKGFFILGTDTNVGKTTIAVNLLSFLNCLIKNPNHKERKIIEEKRIFNEK